MPQFSSTSEERLAECDVVLQGLLHDFVMYFDISIITGHRTEEEQKEKLRKGLSTVDWPNSKHNSKPSKAVDIAPYDPRFGALFGSDKQLREIARWMRDNGDKDTVEGRKTKAAAFVREQYFLMAGLLLAEARHRNVALRWGGDWNQNWDTLDNSFDDLGHFEIV